MKIFHGGCARGDFLFLFNFSMSGIIFLLPAYLVSHEWTLVLVLVNNEKRCVVCNGQMFQPFKRGLENIWIHLVPFDPAKA